VQSRCKVGEALILERTFNGFGSDLHRRKSEGVYFPSGIMVKLL
jgi:hypothetical protein